MLVVKVQTIMYQHNMYRGRCFHILESLRQNAKLQNKQISDRGGSIVQVHRFTFISNKFAGREYLQVSKRQDGIGFYYITGKATEVSSMYVS